MVKIIVKSFVFFLLIMLFVGFASASFTKGNASYSLTKSYGPGEAIKGWVNLSFSNEPANSMFTSSSSSISLIDLIKKGSNSEFAYTCNPLSCSSNYQTMNEEDSKIFNLEENESILFGFELSGKLVTDVTRVLFNLTSNNAETNKFPLAVDILNDGKYEWNAYSSSESLGPANYGCYAGISTGQAYITYGNLYCEKIKISRAPAILLGAYVEGSGDVEFKMKIQKADTGESATCTDYVEAGKIECTPQNFPIINEGSYYVCISAKNSADDRKYKINYEQEKSCGFTGSDTGVYDYDFEIFERPKKYAPNINFTMSDAELRKAGSPTTNLEGYIEEYLTNIYENNCSKGCIIPIRIFSGVDQQIKIQENNSIPYVQYDAGISIDTNDVYDIQETAAQISAKFQKLYLDDSEFLAPATYGNYTFSLSLNDNVLFSEKILVEKVPVINSLTPAETAIKYPTKFKAEIISESNITQYVWDFGDGNIETTTTNSVVHTYDALGGYLLNLGVTNSKGKSSSKEFNITVGPASEIVPTLMEDASFNLANIKMQISAFSQFEQTSLNNFLNIDEVEDNITSLKNSVLTAVSEEDYEAILGSLLEINIPQSIIKTASTEGIIFYPESGNIDLNILKEIGGGDYTGKEEGYKEAIFAWEEGNTNIMLVFNEFSLVYGNYETPLRIFEIGATKKGENDAYIIIKKIENLLFKENYSQKEIDGYYYLTMNTPEKIISFSTTENVDFVNLPVFISPSLTKLSVAEWSPFEQGGNLKKWVLFAIIVLIILLITLIVWIILQIWYKRKYENYLFKDRNNLYNIVSFIEIEKKKGMNEKDIAVKLKKAGWNSEQVTYAVKKYAGKRTGMPEIIPLEKIMSLFQKKEIMKR